MPWWRREIALPRCGPGSRFVLLAALLAAGAALRLVGLDRESFWYDESWSWWLASGDVVSKLRDCDAHPPLYYLLLSLWMRGGDSEVWLRGLSAVFGILTLPLMYHLGKKAAKGGLLPLTFLAFCPYHIRFSQEARSYTLLFFEGALLLCLLVDLRERGGRWRWLGVALLTAAMMYTHYLAALFLVAVAAMAALWARKRTGFGRGAVVALTVAILLYLPWAPIAYQHLFVVQKGFWIPPPTISNLGTSLRELVVWEGGDSYGALAIWSLALMGPWVARSRAAAIWFLPLFVPVAVSLALSLRQSVFYTQTLQFILIPCWILVALAIRHLPRWARMGAVLLVVGVMTPGLIRLHSIPRKENWREAAGLIAKTIRSDEVVLVSPGYLDRNLRYYWREGAPAPLWSTESVNRSWMTSESDEEASLLRLDDRIQQEGFRGVWLVRRSIEGGRRRPSPQIPVRGFRRPFRWEQRNVELYHWTADP